MNHLRISHPKTSSVWVATWQGAGDFLFSFRHSPDFDKYRIEDVLNGGLYKVKNSSDINAIEIEQE